MGVIIAIALQTGKFFDGVTAESSESETPAQTGGWRDHRCSARRAAGACETAHRDPPSIGRDPGGMPQKRREVSAAEVILWVVQKSGAVRNFAGLVVGL